MTQGYGPNNGQQPQWGQGDQNPQQPAQPQWQPASPAPTPAPGGYPGAPAAGAYPGAPGHSAPNGVGSGSRLAKLTQWMLILVAAVIVVRAVRQIVGLVASVVGNSALTSGSMDNGMAVAGAGVIIAGLLYLLVNGLVSLGLLVLSIMVAVQSTGRGRAGAIIVAATLVVSVIVSWIFSGIFTAVLYNAGDFSTIQTVSIISVVVEIVRLLVVFAGLIVGGLMARNWVKRNA